MLPSCSSLFFFLLPPPPLLFLLLSSFFSSSSSLFSACRPTRPALRPRPPRAAAAAKCEAPCSFFLVCLWYSCSARQRLERGLCRRRPPRGPHDRVGRLRSVAGRAGRPGRTWRAAAGSGPGAHSPGSPTAIAPATRASRAPCAAADARARLWPVGGGPVNAASSAGGRTGGRRRP